MKRHLAPVVVLLAAAGCGGSSSPATSQPAVHAGGRVVVHGTNAFRFSPARITVARGPVTIQLVDDGSYPHDFSVPRLHTTSATVTGGLGKQTTTLHLDLRHAGTYRFLCTYHSDAGMTGELVVR